MDTMTFTKAGAAVCGSLLVLLLGKWAAEGLYHVDSHGEQSYVIEVADSGAPAEAVEEVPFSEILAAADIEKGAKVFKKCSACHKIEDGVNSTGPSLYDVVGRTKASEAGFGYSAALTGLGGDWTPEDLSAFLEKPAKYASGTSMSFAGLKKVKDRANLIAYLDSLDN